MNTEQSYTSGFMKRAMEYGLNNQQALQLLKHAAKNKKQPVENTEPEDAKKKQMSKLLRAALIGSGALTGGYLGLRTLPRLLPKGRLAQPGESLLGKLVYSDQGITTPAEIMHLPNGRNLRGLLRKHRDASGLKGTLARAALKADEWLGVPQKHYGVGVGSGRIAEVSKSHGRKVIDQNEFGPKIYIDNEGKILKEKSIPRSAEGRSGTMHESEVEGFNKRYEDMEKNKRFDKRELCPIGSNNCEAYARGIATGEPISRQVQAMRAGGVLGALGTGAGVAHITRDKKEENI